MKQLTQRVQHSSICRREAATTSEPLMPTPLPDYPWQVLGSDLFQLRGVNYLLLVDYSQYPEVVKLTCTTSPAIIAAMKVIFSQHGIPEILQTDNAPQYTPREFKEFSEMYKFRHITSSPRYPQSNGQAERAVQTVKQLINKQLQEQSGDPCMGLLYYRATPFLWCGLSPAEMLMVRQLRTSIPQTDKLLIPNWSYLLDFRQKNQAFKDQ